MPSTLLQSLEFSNSVSISSSTIKGGRLLCPWLLALLAGVPIRLPEKVTRRSDRYIFGVIRSVGSSQDRMCQGQCQMSH